MEMFEFFAFLLEVFAFIGVVSIAAFLFILLCKNHRRTVKDLYPLFAPIRVTIAASWATFYSSWKLVLCVFFQIDRIVRAALKGHNLISDLNADKSRIEKQIEEHKNRISDLKQAVHDLEQSLNERNFSIDEKDQIIEAKKSEIDSLIEKNKRFRNQLADLLNELAHEKLMKEAYRSEYNRENEYWVVWRQQRQQNLNAERQAGYESAMKIANGIDRELKLVKIQLSKVIQENGQFNFAHQRLTNQIAAMNRGKFQMEQMHNSAMTAAKQELQRTLTEVEQQKDEIQHITQQRNELTNEVSPFFLFLLCLLLFYFTYYFVCFELISFFCLLVWHKFCIKLFPIMSVSMWCNFCATLITSCFKIQHTQKSTLIKYREEKKSYTVHLKVRKAY
eukprot:TRINITY_DN2273_c0_g2_i1.p1 TRINITY_DN2273_c0_g2~~TRINITY_DN2273_c0_g2_i1.p1  ORF type:complete len:391 (+),score=58.26 TRINITY_DN2273_c0_g2_i1:178-1350(+)